MVDSDEPEPRSAKDIFLDAIELPRSERGEFIQAQVRGDESLGARVQKLLLAHEEVERAESGGGAWLPEMPKVPALFSDAGEDLHAGTQLGPYRLISEIGQGGFGRVWLTEQLEPVQRQVALKVLKAGLDTREIIQRFHAERQALALMSHPSIAMVYDGGTTERGLPWFAMEFVDGSPITDFCEEHDLGVRARLDLFLSTCRAVQHAHQKGVIHRDIKPTNVLVTVIDGKPSPKVIDFGIAKAIEESLTGDTLETRGGQVLGTPGYMSPEQLDHDVDIDIRADVYSLGALLYEILAGVGPFAKDDGKPLPLSAILVAIQKDDPVIPSLRARQLDGSHRRGVRERDLRGDLDWIVMRCLAKDRDDRYNSVDVLCNEIERHSNGEAVLAGPPTMRYRAGKLFRRHRSLIAFTVLVFALLIGGIISSTNQASRAQAAEAQTRTELERYESISLLLERILLGIDPAQAQRKDTALLLDILDRASAEIEAEGRPAEVEASVRRVLGSAYLSIAEYEASERHFLRALELRERSLGPSDGFTLESVEDLAGLYMHQSREEEAEDLLNRCLAGRLELLGPDDPMTMHVRMNLATLHRLSGRYEVAEVELRELLDWHVRELGETHERTLLIRNNLAAALGDLGRHEEALEIYQDILDAQLRVVSEEHPRALTALNNVGSVLTELRRVDEALPILERALEIKRDVLPEGHPSLLASYSALARVLQMAEDYTTADALFEEGIELGRLHLGENDRRVLILRFNHISLLRTMGRIGEARVSLEDLLPRLEATEPEGSNLIRSAREMRKLLAAG